MSIRTLIILVGLVSPLSLWADATVEGRLDDIYYRPVSGATVSIKDGNTVLQTGITDEEGKFALQITYGDFGHLVLHVTHDDYQDKTETVQIVRYEPTESAYKLRLFPSTLAGCAGVQGAIYVGPFRSPLEEQDLDLTPYVAKVLSDRLTPRLQIHNLRSSLDREKLYLLPQFRECSSAKPLADADGKPMARALKGHGLVWGSIEKDSGGYDIETWVIDSSDAFQLPLSSKSENVTLNQIETAKISALTEAAVLVSVMSKLIDNKQCEAAIYVAHEIAKLTSTDPAAASSFARLQSKASAMKEACQAELPHMGLAGSSP